MDWEPQGYPELEDMYGESPEEYTSIHELEDRIDDIDEDIEALREEFHLIEKWMLRILDRLES